MLITNTTNVMYYVPDNTGEKVIMFDDNWNYIGFKNFSLPANIITIGNNLYITSDKGIYKTSSDLTVLNSQLSTSNFPHYRGIYFNSTNNLLYLASVQFNAIILYDLNLNVKGNITIDPYSPYSIAGLNNQLFVGTAFNGLILLLVDNKIINTFDGCLQTKGALTSITLDQTGLMANVCEESDTVYLYSANGTYANKFISTPLNPEYIGFDSKSRVLIVSQFQISLFAIAV